MIAGKAVSDVISKKEKVEPAEQADSLSAETPSLATTESVNTSNRSIPENPIKKPLTPAIEVKQKSDALYFPQIISEKLRQQIIQNLGADNLTKKMQQLVDYFAERLRSGKVRSPIDYFVGLKERWLNNTLELNQTPSQTQPQQQYATGAEKEAHRQQIEKRHAYQDAILDFKQTKRVVKMMMEQKNATFEQAIKELNYTQIWEKAVKLLKQTHEAYLPS
jgi:hypothetical protein